MTEPIKIYKDKADLIKKIIFQYLKEIKATKKCNEEILKDKEWAASDDDYHRECRKETKLEIENIAQQIRDLS